MKATLDARTLFEKVRKKCRFVKEGKCMVTRNPPDSCNYDECPRKTRFEWIKPSIACVLCDFGQCDKCSMVWCKECKAALCLDHMEGHLETCGSSMDVYARMRYEHEFIDGKKWIEE